MGTGSGSRIIIPEGKLDLREIYKGAEDQRNKRIAELERISKPLHELVFSENFRIIDVIGESYPTSYSPMPHMGGSSPTHDTGFTSRLTLDVDPEDKDIAVKTLKFDGFSIVRAGDYVTAKIPRYKEEIVKGGFYAGYSNERVFYLERSFEPVEFAIELVIFGDN